MKSLRGWMLLCCVVALGLAVIGCGAQSTEGPDTSSHWLSACKSDDNCSDGQECLCGVCTKACERTSECRGLSADARCVEPDNCGAQAVCALESTFESNVSSGPNMDASVDTPLDTSLDTGVAPDPNDGSTSVSSVVSTDPSNTTSDVLSAPNTPVPEGCEFLTEQALVTPLCRSSEGQCEQAKNESVPRSYLLTLDERYQDEDGNDVPYSDDEMERRQQCLVDAAKNLGFEAQASSLWIDVTGTWLAVEPLVRAAGSYYVGCDDCEYCYAFDEAACGLDAFCVPLPGRKVNLIEECLEPEAFFECLPASSGCSDLELWASVDGDQCYYFPSICSTRRDREDRGEACAAEGHDITELHAFETCTGDGECFSPWENSDHSSLEELPGCACADEAHVAACVMGAHFFCREGAWAWAEDGICPYVREENCGARFDTLEECFESYQNCFPFDEGVCALDLRGDDVIAMIGAGECETSGGVVVEGLRPSREPWIDIDPTRYCEVPTDPVPSALCVPAGGILQCDVSDAGYACGASLRSYAVKDCDNGEPGVCCMPL